MKYFSMFSGIGGFEYGMEQSKHDFECVGFCEVDKYAISIYTRHFPTHKNYGDATKIHTEDLPDFEFLVGGFPCQAFSIAGKRKGFNEARGTLFFEIARILRDKKPRYFLLENVKGLLSHEGGRLSKQFLGSAMNSGMMYHGRFIIPRIMVSRRTVKGYLLKDILETNVGKKYYLTEEQSKKLLET